MSETGAVVDVGIVGAGPAGLFAANVLVRAEIDCLVLERLDEEAVRARARAGLIEDRTRPASAGPRPGRGDAHARKDPGRLRVPPRRQNPGV